VSRDTRLDAAERSVERTNREGAMSKVVELLRHTDNDGDILTEAGVQAALKAGAQLSGDYNIMISSGAQRATQTIGCLLAASEIRVSGGVVVDDRFVSKVEDRWRSVYKDSGATDLEGFRKADPELVESESRLCGAALVDVVNRLSDGGRALVVGHSPTQEVAALGVTGEVVRPLGKGESVRIISEAGGYRVER
jgi:broad specificity phosphatase PhoE